MRKLVSSCGKQKVEKRQGMTADLQDWKMEFQEEVETEKNLDEQRKMLQKQIREIVKFKDMDAMFLSEHSE